MPAADGVIVGPERRREAPQRFERGIIGSHHAAARSAHRIDIAAYQRRRGLFTFGHHDDRTAFISIGYRAKGFGAK